MKTHRGAAKRFKLTANGKVKRRKQNMRHILTKMDAKRKRQLTKATLVDKSDEKRVKRMLGVG
jgi:large subunit ribosomal protein L35